MNRITKILSFVLLISIIFVLGHLSLKHSQSTKNDIAFYCPRPNGKPLACLDDETINMLYRTGNIVCTPCRSLPTDTRTCCFRWNPIK